MECKMIKYMQEKARKKILRRAKKMCKFGDYGLKKSTFFPKAIFLFFSIIISNRPILVSNEQNLGR